jgi:hypothetical protein
MWIRQEKSLWSLREACASWGLFCLRRKSVSRSCVSLGGPGGSLFTMGKETKPSYLKGETFWLLLSLVYGARESVIPFALSQSKGGESGHSCFDGPVLSILRRAQDERCRRTQHERLKSSGYSENGRDPVIQRD